MTKKEKYDQLVKAIKVLVDMSLIFKESTPTVFENYEYRCPSCGEWYAFMNDKNTIHLHSCNCQFCQTGYILECPCGHIDDLSKLESRLLSKI